MNDQIAVQLCATCYYQQQSVGFLHSSQESFCNGSSGQAAKMTVKILDPVAAMTMVSMGVTPCCPVNIKDKISMPEAHSLTEWKWHWTYLSQMELIRHLSQKLGLITYD